MYSSKKILLPQPVFYVFYNGIAHYPDQNILKLSDMFEDTGINLLFNNGFQSLELTAKVININAGKNTALVEKNVELAGYSVFTDKVREYRKTSDDLETALVKAIRHCREHGILKEFLEEHGSVEKIT